MKNNKAELELLLIGGTVLGLMLYAYFKYTNGVKIETRSIAMGVRG